MNVSIVMPWRDMGCPHRRRAFDFVTAYWLHHLPDAELLVHGGPEPFSRAAALNAAVRCAWGDVLFEIGPDGIVTPGSVREALREAEEAPGLVVCHDRYLHLNPRASERILAAGHIAAIDYGDFREDDCEEHGTTSVDVACFSRETWEQAGGYDERFGVWGGDDGAFAIACGQLVAPMRRVRGTWVHLWHPRLPQSYPGHPGYTDQQVLINEYLEANEAGPEAMRRLVATR